MKAAASERILVTPSSYSRNHYLYVQEIGTLKSLEPHISRREKLESYLFFMVTEGSGTVTRGGSTRKLHAGDCVWINCLEPYSHESSRTQPWSLMWVHFNGFQAPEFYRLYTEKDGPAVYTPTSLAPYIKCLQTLYRLQQQKDALTDLLSHRYLTDLIAQIFSDTFQNHAGLPVPQKFMDIRSYIEAHYAEKLTLDDLSALFYISKYHLLREYQRLFGITVINDITARRLSYAKSRLRFSSDSIETIALQSGFQTSSYFIKVFKRYESMTPLEYRRKW